MRRGEAVMAVVTLLFAAGCSDSCREYSNYSCSQLEKQTYNVLVYPPSGREYHVGREVGLEACGVTAWGYAEAKGFSRSNDWSYICCLETKDSACAEKHR
jgi:hypothetical protein